jgi:hypothetical protein
MSAAYLQRSTAAEACLGARRIEIQMGTGMGMGMGMGMGIREMDEGSG